MDGAEFHDTVNFSGAQFANVRGLQANEINLCGAVLESANFWGIEEIKQHDFSGAFLLSLSLANKAIIDCNFTGAVFDAVHTRGWEVNDATRCNTLFIYTAYEIVQEPDEESGELRPKLIPKPGSRVPARGNFGEGEHANFFFDDYLKDPVRWSFAVDAPAMVRSAFLDFIAEFPEFMRLEKGIGVEIRQRQEGGMVRVEFCVSTEAERKEVNEAFPRFYNRAKQGAESVENEFITATSVEAKMLVVRLDRKISALRNDVQTGRILLEQKQQIHQLETEKRDLQRQMDELDRFDHDPTIALQAEEPPAPLLPAPPQIQARMRLFFLQSDIPGFSKFQSEDPHADTELRSWLVGYRQYFSQLDGHLRSDIEGDSIKGFFNNYDNLLEAARYLHSKGPEIKFEFPQLEGFRILLNTRYAHTVPDGENHEFTTPGITETVRTDQPMKDFLKARNLSQNAVWCLEPFQAYVEQRHVTSVQFEAISETLQKGKNDGNCPQLYWVRFIAQQE
ncbi:hypothetical protein MAIT1_00735 [Magnetofaba australis IT-1]|uniref:Pentapeptide repeat-containing protein n=2 Tax=Magnetofaba TaxID=1472292 RepID=A0A1Y2JZF7_9PROT|nr:hypothetical protein MAIT1_00735 [Magnetofaba australis IT-1]